MNIKFKLVVPICLLVFYTLMNTTVFAGTPEFFFTVASQDNLSDSGMAFNFGTVNPGDALTGTVSLVMLEETGAAFDLQLTSGTGFEFATDVPNWVTYSEGTSIYLSGKGTKIVSDYKIQLPQDMPPGEYRFTLAAALMSYDGQGEFAGSGIKVAPAVGVRVYFDIPGERFYGFDFESFTYDKGMFEVEEVIKVSLQYQNTGNAIVYPYTDIRVKDFNGDIIYDQGFDISDSRAGTGLSSDFILEDIDVSSLERFDIEADLYYSTALGGERIFVETKNIRIYVIPWTIVIIVSAVVLLIVLWFIYRFILFRVLKSKSFSYEVHKGDNLQTICKKYSVNPKRVIFLNKLKSPYFLDEGKSILIPKAKK